MIVPISGIHVTEVDVWAALPPSRRDAAMDYLLRGEPRGRIRRAFGLAGHLYGYQDTYTVSAEPVPPDGWAVACTCGRRLPCAHVGALLLAWVREPESFRRWEVIQADLPPDPAWAWASGRTFPWGSAEGTPPPWSRPPTPDASGSSFLAGPLGAAALAKRVRETHPAWWERPDTLAALAARVSELARRPLEADDLLPWIDLASDFPDLPLGPLWQHGAAAHPLVEATWWGTWWELWAQWTRRPRPALQHRLLGFQAHLGDWLIAQSRQDLAVRAWERLAPLDPYGFARADWFYRHGLIDRARRALESAALPDHPEGLAARESRWRLLTEAAAAPGPPPE
jgi:hypothetical protein